MKTRILESDIDALVDTAALLTTLAKTAPEDTARHKLANLASHVRKIYVLMLHATGLSHDDLKQMFFPGVETDPDLAMAIDILCPLTEENPKTPTQL